jgi:hypothetical protein
MMDFARQKLFLELFYSGCLTITNTKGRDYTPDGIPLLEVLETAVDDDLDIQQVMWVYFRKHMSAIKRHLLQGRTESEPILERYKDAANYVALMAFYETDKRAFHQAWREYWSAQPCECLYQGDETTAEFRCQKCETLSWLERKAFGLNSKATSSPLTPKAPD